MDPATIVFLAVVLLVFYVVFSAVKIVPEYERLVVLALGRYSGTRGPGLVFLIPLLERAFRVDTRERFLDIPSQTAITLDNAPINIDFLVYYRITEPKLAVLMVDNVVSASTNIATTTLRAVIGDIDLDSVLSQRERINDTLRIKLDETTERWGLKVTSVEIREIQPPREVQDAMNRQMTAERERRAAVIRASGEREAAIAVAEGDKQSAILRSEGMKQSSVLEAEGARQAEFLRAQGYAAALAAIYAEASKLDDKTMMLQYFDTLSRIGSSSSTKFVIPMEVTAMLERFALTLSNTTAEAPRRPATSMAPTQQPTPQSGD